MSGMAPAEIESAPATNPLQDKPRRPPASGSIRQLGERLFEVTVTLGTDPLSGKQRRRSKRVRGPRRDAEALLRRMIETAEDEIVESSETLAAIVDDWLDREQHRLTPTTRTSYAVARTKLIKGLGTVRVSDLSVRQVESFYASLSAAGLSFYSIRIVHALLRKVLTDSARREIVTRNVAALARIPVPRPQTEAASPTPEQLSIIIERAQDKDSQLANLVALAAVTGLRRGELVALRASDLIDGVLTVARSATYTKATGVVIGPTKTKQTRRIALDSFALAVIERQKQLRYHLAQQCSVTLPDDFYLFAGSPDGSIPWHPDTPSKLFRSLCDSLGWTQFHLHSLRHFAATQLIAAGVDIRTVSGRLGHSTPNVTLAIYSHSVSERDQDAAAIIGGVISKALVLPSNSLAAGESSKEGE